ncbi:hypothetical protein GCM10020358_38370 [Amorphoplanes nipponensis]|uniref:Uncharacterized protein n=1 Tax=Actinoplanes nipponensis TaxID=135950 RepID=A0A919JK63_9ACTN|nr:hypothetical protein [Actinoplanes nipponensis]GIE48264.1 hypothetical protein Ani05nite_17980 [Actinoplanes nipponensis]
MRGTHIRHRRGVVAALIAALLVTGVTVVIVGVLGMRDDDAPAAPAATTADGRRPWQVTLEVAASSGYVVTAAITDGDRQTLTVQNLALGGKPDGTYGGEVTAFPPGTLDESQFGAVEQGDEFRYLENFAFAGHAAGETAPWRTPAVGRRDPSGTWIVVYADSARADGRIARADLLRLAQAVTLGSPRDLRLPLRLGIAPPESLRLTYVRSPDHRIDRRPAAVGFSTGSRAPSGAAVYPGPPGGLSVALLTAARDASWPGRRATLTGKTEIAKLPAWYEPNGRLTVETEHCIVTVESHLPRKELDALIENLVIGDCADPESWIPPLS